jgi:hypothetical protein
VTLMAGVERERHVGFQQGALIGPILRDVENPERWAVNPDRQTVVSIGGAFEIAGVELAAGYTFAGQDRRLMTTLGARFR